MNENERPLEEAQPEQPLAPEAAEPVSETIEAASAAARQAAAEADAAAEALGETAAGAARETAGPEPAGEPAPKASAEADLPAPIMSRLTEDSIYDETANNDDKLLAALAYGSQLIIPILVPIILLVSETSKKRPFQKYHAVQSLALGVALWVVQGALGILATIAAASFIGLLCLCIIVPAMIVVWLLPLYYAILAYSGQRFTIPGLTQFLRDQRWL